MRRNSLIFMLATLFGLACTPVSWAQQARQADPEISTGSTAKAGWTARSHMVAAANPLAVDAGVKMLDQGGSAIDAAIATQMMLTLVEPQSSGIGGGAFILYFDGKKVHAFDGRETAPSKATERLFQDANGVPVARLAGLIGGRSVGAPGVLRALDMAHRQFGKLPWKTLFAPAIAMAENGFPVSHRLNALLNWDVYLKKDPVAAATFYDANGKAWPVGHILKNAALAATLREIADGGADVFYTGHIARDIAAKVAAHPSNPGLLTAADIAGYQAKMRDPVCNDYRRWTICGMPPPSSGGVAVAQMLGILEIKDIRPFAPVNGELNPQAVHLFSEAGRLAYADRDRYPADPDFVPLPGRGVAGLLDKTYLAQRAALIGDKSMGQAMPGKPPGMEVAWGMDNAPEWPSTSHLSAVDSSGAGLSMTTTIEDAFGSRQMVDGFLLNNQLTDFSFASSDAEGPIANRVQAGKRPRSTMSPTLVFDKETRQLMLLIGSPGGPAIINYVAKVLIGTLDWGLNVQQAISLPNLGSRNGPTLLEAGRVQPGLVEALQAKGHTVREVDQNSGLHGIMRMTGKDQPMWFGGADPRREGVARGD